MGDSTLPESVAFAESCMSKVPPDVYGATIHTLVTFEGRDALPDIQVPTLVLAGEQDINAPAGMMERMASKIAGAEYVCLSGAGHLASIEVAEAFNWAVLDFISRHR
jgi:pimeloyl-ACP methyl ester carboxylesterase